MRHVSTPILLALSLSSVLALGCASTPVATPATPAEKDTAAPADSAKPDAPPAAPAAGARDPKIVALAKAALACKFEDDYFDDDCAAYKAWNDNEELFDEHKGDETIFSMYADSDVKIRILASRHGLPQSFFEDKARATRLFDISKAETNATVAHDLGRYVANVDAEKLGLGNELKALAKHPQKTFRDGLAFYLISTYQSPIALEVEQMLINDEDERVRETAVSALSTGGVTPGIEPICKLLTAQLKNPDASLAGSALWAGTSSKCPGMKEQVAAELDKRTADPSKIQNSFGIRYSLAVDGLCGYGTTPEQQKKGFAIAKRLVDPKVPDPNTRRSSLRTLAKCDPVAAQPILKSLAKDKEKFVADGVASALKDAKEYQEKAKKDAAEAKAKPKKK
jgi:hypothetical protein